MALKLSRIPYCDYVLNVTAGCSWVSEGCRNCWALELIHNRFSHLPRYAGITRDDGNGPRWTGKVSVMVDRLKLLDTARPGIVFINSQSDLFYPGVPFEVIDQVMKSIATHRDFFFLLLTKYPQRAKEYFDQLIRILWTADRPERYVDNDVLAAIKKWPPSNWAMGASICKGSEAGKLSVLTSIWAPYHWVSFEPLVGPINVNPDWFLEASTIEVLEKRNGYIHMDWPDRFISWAVIGGESGVHARPMCPEWPIHLISQIRPTGCAINFKQWGAYAPPKAEDYVYESSAEAAPPLIMNAIEGFIPVSNGQRPPRYYPMRKINKKDDPKVIHGETLNEYPYWLHNFRQSLNKNDYRFEDEYRGLPHPKEGDR